MLETRFECGNVVSVIEIESVCGMSMSCAGIRSKERKPRSSFSQHGSLPVRRIAKRVVATSFPLLERYFITLFVADGGLDRSALFIEWNPIDFISQSGV